MMNYLKSTNEQFSANKLSLNAGKTKFSLFYKSGKKYSIPSPLPMLKIKNNDIRRVDSIKFLGVLLDNYLSQKERIKDLENKIAKKIRLIYRTKLFLDKEAQLLVCPVMSNLYQLSLGQYLLKNFKKARYSTKKALFKKSIIRQNLNFLKQLLY